MTLFQRINTRLSVLLLCTVFCFLTGCGTPVQDNTADDGGLVLKYADKGVTRIEDMGLDDVQQSNEKVEEGVFALSYKNDAISYDGTNFVCYIGNSDANSYDFFINIYADAALTDELFLSGLIRPGEAFESLTLNHPLETGTHRVYVFYTQVEDDKETIHSQTAVTMDFTVLDE